MCGLGYRPRVPPGRSIDRLLVRGCFVSTDPIPAPNHVGTVGHAWSLTLHSMQPGVDSVIFSSPCNGRLSVQGAFAILGYQPLPVNRRVPVIQHRPEYTDPRHVPFRPDSTARQDCNATVQWPQFTERVVLQQVDLAPGPDRSARCRCGLGVAVHHDITAARAGWQVAAGGTVVRSGHACTDGRYAGNRFSVVRGDGDSGARSDSRGPFGARRAFVHTKCCYGGPCCADCCHSGRSESATRGGSGVIAPIDNPDRQSADGHVRVVSSRCELDEIVLHGVVLHAFGWVGFGIPDFRRDQACLIRGIRHASRQRLQCDTH